MPVGTLLLQKPTTIFLFYPQFKPRKPVSCSQFSVPRSIFAGRSVRWNSRILGPNTMAESIRSSGYRANSGDEGVGGLGALEQEAFVGGSPGFRPNLRGSGLEATLNSLSKWLVAALFATIILWRHDAEALWAAMGSVLNAWLSVMLKWILNQERPVSTLRSDPGMPSSHSQSIFYTVVFTVLSIVQWLGLNALTATLSGLILALGSYFSWLRVSQQLHTVTQVIVGALVGSTFSILWFWSWDAVVVKLFVSYLWVRLVVILGAAGVCLGFFLYMIRYWVMDELCKYTNNIMR